MVAVPLKSTIKDYIFASHQSVERGHKVLLKRLKQKPMLDLSMRLGEGTGAVLGIGLIESGVRIINEVLTFDEAGVSEAIQ